MQPPIMVLGFPRSGTTWLSKILDSSPATLLRHEPDTMRPTREFPFALSASDLAEHAAAARRYLLERCGEKALRSVGGPPFFEKSYRRAVTDRAHRGLVTLLRVLDSAARGRLERRVPVPDWVSRGEEARLLLKSVDSAARTSLFAQALPEARFVFIIRHPCGVIGSRRRGIKAGKMTRGRAFADWLHFDLARELGLSREDLDGWSPLEVSAWGWTLVNDTALRGIGSSGNVLVVRYEDLCQDPLALGRRIFDFCDLPWQQQTESYLRLCMGMADESVGSYYSVTKNPAATCDRWKSEFPEEEVEAVRRIALRGRGGEFFFREPAAGAARG